MSITDSLFLAVPLISTLCSLFLFLTVLGAKKNRTIYAFMLLLLSFTAWSAGSLFLRLRLYPGERFWYEVSITGIFCVPFLIYNFIYCFTGKRAPLTRLVYMVSWTVIAVLNIVDVFIKHPQIVLADGSREFNFIITPWAIIPILYAAVTLFSAGRMVVRNIRRDGVPIYVYRPLFIGVIIMFIGTVSDAIPSLGSFPADTLVCGINSICIYYTLYKKRLIPLSRIASGSSTYLLSAVFTTAFMAAAYPSIELFYNSRFDNFSQYKTLAFAVLFSVISTLVYNVIRRLMSDLFVKGEEARNVALRSFSGDVSKTLDIKEIIELYKNYLRENTQAENAFICIPTADGSSFRAAGAVREYSLADLSISTNSPLADLFRKHGHSVTLEDFKRTVEYKSMWESEKRMLSDSGARLMIPIMYDGSLTGITILTPRSDGKDYSFSEVTFMESTASILSVALQNSSLYSSLQREARTDSLTGLYNRRYFIQRISEDFRSAFHDVISFMIFNMDDFHLFNELYGSMEGDAVLVSFARILDSTIGPSGSVCRYSGKEFAVFLPFCPPSKAAAYADEIRTRFAGYISEKYGIQPGGSLTFSCGICGYPMSASGVDELQNRCGMAVFSAKQNGKARTVVYSSSIDPDNEKGAARRKLSESCSQMIFALTAAIDAKDHYTFNHSQAVAAYAAQLAEHIPLDGEHVEIIRQAGLLHDIGKIAIPEAILSKTSRLTDEEYAIMKTHVERCVPIIRYLPSLDYVIPSAVGHHERWDGRGYPRGLKGEEIPIGARCLGIADAFDAMISRRPYRDPMPLDLALNELRRGLGSQFDPELGALFIRLVEDGTIKPLNH